MRYAPKEKNIIRMLFLSLVFTSLPLRSDFIQVPFGSTDNWVLPETGAEILTYNGRQALRLKKGDGERIAYLKDFTFENGIIELDIAALPSYTGLVFRVRTDQAYEGIYFRPQNSGHKDPGRHGHTVQYHAPPRYTWFYFREKAPEKYETGASLTLREWFHVRVEVSGLQAKVYINGSTKPDMIINDLKHGVSRGSVGLWCGNGSEGTFANLKIQTHEDTDTSTLPEPKGSVKTKLRYSPEQEYLFDIFKKRRSVRKFLSTPIPDEHILKILDIARSGPTSGNQQPWKFLVIQDRDKLDLLRDECVSRALERTKKRIHMDTAKIEETRQRLHQRYTDYLSAPVYIVVLVDKNSRYPSYNIYDGSVAAGFLMIAARALGYGTVFSQDTIPYDLIKKTFEIPDNFIRICFTPIGVPEEWPEPREKKPLREFAVFEKLIQGVNFKVPVKRKAIQMDAKILKEYAGRFQIEGSSSQVSITAENIKIYIQVDGQPKYEIFAEERDKFFMKIADIQLSFTRDNGGKISGFILHQGGRNIKVNKIEK
jgi:nitroreductase